MQSSAASCSSFPCGNKGLLLLHEVFVVEDVRRRAYQLEPDSLVALIACRKQVTAVHHNFMGGSMFAIMDDFVDTGFGDWDTRRKHLVMPKSRPGMPGETTAILGSGPLKTCPVGLPLFSRRSHWACGMSSEFYTVIFSRRKPEPEFPANFFSTMGNTAGTWSILVPAVRAWLISEFSIPFILSPGPLNHF